jgi:glutaredoxin
LALSPEYEKSQNFTFIFDLIFEIRNNMCYPVLKSEKEANFMSMTKVDGKNRGNIKLYAISTCIWCKKTKALLDEKEVEYKYVFVDKLSGEEKEKVKEELKEWNPACSYPTIIVNGKCIVGFEEYEIITEIEK